MGQSIYWECSNTDRSKLLPPSSVSPSSTLSSGLFCISLLDQLPETVQEEFGGMMDGSAGEDLPGGEWGTRR